MKKFFVSAILLLIVLQSCLFESEKKVSIPPLVVEDLYGCWLEVSPWYSDEVCEKYCVDPSGYIYSLATAVDGPYSETAYNDSYNDREEFGRLEVNFANNSIGGGGIDSTHPSFPEGALNLPWWNSKSISYEFPGKYDQGGLTTGHFAEVHFYVHGDSLMSYNGADWRLAATRLDSMNAACAESWYYFKRPPDWSLK